MAKKYIIHGETYCGDGTTSAAATSNGGAGALNSLIYFEGTTWPAPAVLAAGDTVFIRSKDAAGAAITRIIASTTTLGAQTGIGTSDSMVKWVVDNGAVWAGVNGVLTYECPSTYLLKVRDYNHVAASEPDQLVIKEANTAPSYKAHLGGTVYLTNILCDFHTVCGTGGTGTKLEYFLGTSRIVNLHIKSAKYHDYLVNAGAYASITFVNLWIELPTVISRQAVIASWTTGYLTLIGGAITGVGATSATAVAVVGAQGAKIRMFGFQFPHEMPISSVNITYSEQEICATGSDGLSGVRGKEMWGEYCSRTDAYFPTLSAQLPDAAGTKWSWWVYPYGASSIYPGMLEFGKVFTEAAAVKVVTLEVLVSTLFTNVNASNLWMVVSYTDNATGLPKAITTQNGASTVLATSVATWLPDPPTYGATAYDKRSLSVTTPTEIKPDTMIHVTLFVSANADSATRTILCCPDFVLSAP